MVAEKSQQQPLEAFQKCLKDIFSEKFTFYIPRFQRPFSWETDDFDKLFTDIQDVVEVSGNSMESDYNESYFLGSITLTIREELKPDDSAEYEIVDGQQRLVSLTLLFAVIRDMLISLDEGGKLNKDEQEGLADLKRTIKQPKGIYTKQEEKARLYVREADTDFYESYVLKDGGTANIASDHYNKNQSEAQLHMQEAITVFRNGFMDEAGNINKDFLQSYLTFLLNHIFIVVVRTKSLSSAFRLFNVINTRGMPLNNSDLLKSYNLEPLDREEEKRYADLWESCETDIGVENLETLISMLRHIMLQKKARKSIYEEFEREVFKRDKNIKGKRFITRLRKITELYMSKIQNGTIQTTNPSKQIYYYNLVTLMRDFLPFNDWMAPLLRFAEKYNGQDESLYDFQNLLERKVAVDWVSRLSFTERLTQLYAIIKLIDDNDVPAEVMANDIFSGSVSRNRTMFEQALDATNLYSRGRMQVPKYLLLRMEMERRQNTDVQMSYGTSVTVEHILPRTPKTEYWTDRFTETDRLKWTDMLGNLVVLNGRKNSSAGNKPFPDKRDKYFQEKSSDFQLVNELNYYDEWSLNNLIERHEKLRNEALRIWLPAGDN